MLMLIADGKTVASGSRDGTVRLWDAATGEEQAVLRGHDQEVLSVAFSADGKTVASGSRDGTVRLWDAATGKEQVALRGHDQKVLSVAFSADGKTVASGSQDGTVRLWDAVTGEEKAAWRVLFRYGAREEDDDNHHHNCLVVAFSPDGNTVASGSMDHTLRLWDAATGEEKVLMHLPRDNQSGDLTDHRIHSVAFSPDGKTVAIGSTDNEVLLADAAPGSEQTALMLRGHDGKVYSVAFSVDGKTVVSGSQDGTVRLP
ncbi:hypothetical protein CYMTET_15499 [Cymbomonas tetramitiformis]|uniref:Uncharacterized protein n=1 Tax=Cymbomonas tetramitiformis TaxID=36881 RepID=A0AAE0L8Y1_9CHLO|nr:hypothetical protein CYMTET_15499 [Cymbomonas tetramitiformis]